MKNNSRIGFTMIEILTSIAIIAVLVALVLTVLGRARSQSRDSVCISQMRQIGNALSMYRQDYDGEFPRKLSWLDTTYTKTKDVFFCPNFLMTLVHETPEKQKHILEQLVGFSSYEYTVQTADFYDKELPREPTDPAKMYTTWERAYEIRGEELPLLLCQWHDPKHLRKEGRSRDQPRMTARLNGSVSLTRMLPGKPGQYRGWYER